MVTATLPFSDSIGTDRFMADKAPSWLKPVIDYAPLVVFIAAYAAGGLMTATAALMISTALVLVVSLALTGKVPVMPLITALVVGVFGGLTLWLNDETFIKMKPTIVYVLFSAVVGGGLLFGRIFLKALFGEALGLDDHGWWRLSIRFALFFLAMAVANEIIWRSFPTDWWVLWKVPGSIILTLAFMVCQMPLIRRHSRAERK